jgi:hypothetical protein
MQPINYTEKGFGLHEAVSAAGHQLVEQDGAWLADDPVAVQAIVDSYDALAVARTKKWDEIKAKRESVKYAGVPIASVGKVIDTDEGARTQQLGLVLMGAALPDGLLWKFADNTLVAMTPALAQEVMATTAARDMAGFSVAETYRAQINAMADWQAVLALDISGGWPA